MTASDKAKQLVKYLLKAGLKKQSAKEVSLFIIDEIMNRDKRWVSFLKRKFLIDLDIESTKTLLLKTKEKINQL